jgi:hypothetical protein
MPPVHLLFTQSRSLAGAHAAARPRRSHPRANPALPRALGDQVFVPHRLPSRECGRLTGIRPAPPPPTAEGPNCIALFLCRGPGANVLFFRVSILQELVKCVENRRKFRKMQNQFCWVLCDEYYNFCYSYMV